MDIKKHHITAKEDKIPFTQKVAYGLGAMSTNVAINSLGNLALLIYVSGLGVSPALIGIVMAIPRFWDAITDPLVGNLSDNTRSRFGRRKPYIFFGAIALGIGFAMLWMAPKGWSENVTFAYIVMASVFFYTAITVFDVPRGALGYEMTDDYHERTRLFAYSSFIINVGALSTPWLYWLATRSIFKDEIVGMRYVGLVMGVLLFLGGVICALVCKERKFEQAKHQTRTKFWESFAMTCKNRTFLWLLAIVVLVTIGFTFVSGWTQMIILHYVYSGDKQTASQLIGWVGTLWASLSLPGVFVMTWIATRIGKSKTVMVFLLVMAFGNALKIFCYSQAHPYLILIPTASLSLGMLVLFSLVYAMLADICDEDEIVTGKRREGSYHAIYGWWFKVGIATGLLVAGFVLKATGFDSDLEVQTQFTLFWLRFCDIVLPSFVCICGALLLVKYPLTEKRAYEIKAILRERREAAGIENADSDVNTENS
ncbi:MAG: MFS transporter [Planctomycetes bacterium]|nr:MFS transporter [Planctomycetota bacterium]